jgi:hypothetical protein
MQAMIAQASAWFQQFKMRIVRRAPDVVTMAVLGTAVFFIVFTAVVGSVIFVFCVRPLQRRLGYRRDRRERMMSNACGERKLLLRGHGAGVSTKPSGLYS